MTNKTQFGGSIRNVRTRENDKWRAIRSIRSGTGALRLNARKLARKYNRTDEDQPEEQAEILRKLLPATKQFPYLQAPVYFDYGCNTYFGKYSSANFNFTCLDVCEVHIGDNVMIGPNVTLATPMHPLLPEERNIQKREDGSIYNLEYARPITIKDNCWLASNVVVCGGVTIGEGCVIGAGSVVTRDIPPYSLGCRKSLPGHPPDNREGPYGSFSLPGIRQTISQENAPAAKQSA